MAISPHAPARCIQSATAPRPAQSIAASGFQAAEQWHASLCASAEAAQGYFFPSGLRQALEAQPSASGRADFLDAIGALLVVWLVSGEPEPGAYDLGQEVRRHALTHAEQDRLAGGSHV